LRLLLLLTVFLPASFAQLPVLRWEKVLTGLRQPTHATSARDGSNRLFIAEQAGLVKVYADGALLPTPFLDIRERVNFGGELGLLSIVFPPGFSGKQYFYAYYIDKRKAVTLSRFKVTENPNLADPETETVILNLPQPYGQHNGGMAAFSPVDGMMYIGTGDGGYAEPAANEFEPDPQGNGQRADTLLGKMLRIDTESGTAPYAIPQSNPTLPDSRPEIWAKGLRNPWRFSFDRATGDLYIGDVGNNLKEEVDFEPAGSAGGLNYGWSLREGNSCLPEAPCPDVPNLTLPIHDYTHDLGCSVIGGVVYRGAKYPALQGLYLFTDFCTSMISGLRKTGDGWKRNDFDYADGLLVTFAEDEDGEIYVVDWDGNLLRMTVPDPAPAPGEERRRPPGRPKLKGLGKH
jgi:glucose/arabinose dehydrogenase